MTELNNIQKNYAKIIQDSCVKLLTIVNDILDFSKIEAGKLDLEIIDFSLIQLIKNQSDLLLPKVRNKGLAFSTYIDPNIPTHLKGDPGRTGQILLNLIGNAIKFTSSGSVFVEVKLEENTITPLGDEPFRVRFSIRDTGPGIAPGAVAQLFQPFVQADTSMNRKYGGTGLGLSISKQLVKLMKGEIGVDSTEDEGSCFWFTLPLLKGESQSSKMTVPSRPAGMTQDMSRVLLVEDNVVNQMVAKTLLEKMGVSVLIAANGVEALQHLEMSIFHLILMDCQMPVMDGFEATRAIRRMTDPEKSQIPIIALTANAMNGDEERCLKVGMDDYLSKPIQRRIFERKVEQWLRSTKPSPDATI